ncbi:metalloproteinase [Matsumuraeses phaseoli granulovirus]|uniref:Metalloproteinase n=1 Tax=Matsumuraeses phaseoli granulovirus TaxID=2760664 RepID=A0AAE7SY88_9BBAC|nr:metalloproteinase [Matsumuraeses phaseoli granulovirus]QOD40001.1 metalloproteinase [Matsumuraeses phaseoli granulovirus]
MQNIVLILTCVISVQCKERLNMKFVMNKNGSFTEIFDDNNQIDDYQNDVYVNDNVINDYSDVLGVRPEDELKIKSLLKPFLTNEAGFVHKLGLAKLLRDKRFFVNQDIYWPNKHNITYTLYTNTVPKYLNVDMLSQETRQAFDVWQNVISYSTKVEIVKFVNIGDNCESANIKISFVNRHHGDKYDFDGMGGVLAHAYVPPVGEIHLDNEELWLVNNRYHVNGTKYITMLVHEIGHAIGLYHSSDKDSFMYSYYNSDKTELDDDDINGLDQLYVHNDKASKILLPSTNNDNSITSTTAALPTITPPTYKSIPNWVYETMSNSIDEICEHIPVCVTSIRGEYFVFGATKYWRFRDFRMTQLVESVLIKQGLWPELCQVMGASTLGEKIIFVDNYLQYIYNTTSLDVVRVLTNKYRAMFEEDGVLYGVDVNGQDLYELNAAFIPRYVGKVSNKFLGIQQVDWVIINDDLISVGIGRGRWLFEYTNIRDEHVGKKYIVTGDIEPLMYRC